MPTPDKYAYLLTNPLWYKLRLLLGYGGLVVSGVGLVFLAADYPLLTLPFGLLFAYIGVFLTLAAWIGLSYRPFDRVAHWRWRREFQASTYRPSVDVYLPVCGEPLETLRTTWQAVDSLDYPHYQVHVLDDGHNPRVRALAKLYGFNYIARTNRGHLKKAGNIRYAFARTSGEFFTILDADFAPRPDYLWDLLPYLTRDPRTAIVQSPQAFDYPESTYDTAPLAYAASLIQEDFYRRTQVGLDTLGATVCVGSNALYRRSSLSAVSGAAPVPHSEDLHTGFEMVTRGHRVKYIPLRLAFGGVPDTLGAWIKQQIRWCQGSLALVPTRKFWTTPLRPATRLAYTSGFLYYYSSFATLLMPYLGYATLYAEVPLAPSVGLYYLPVILTNWIFFPRFRTQEFRPALAYVYWLLTYIHILTILQHLTGRVRAWVPTASGRVSKSEQHRVLNLVGLNLATHLGLLIPLLFLIPPTQASLGQLLVLTWSFLETLKPIWLLAYTYLRIDPIVSTRQNTWLYSQGIWELGLTVSVGILLGTSLLFI